jgi:hypothetical protein
VNFCVHIAIFLSAVFVGCSGNPPSSTTTDTVTDSGGAADTSSMIDTDKVTDTAPMPDTYTKPDTSVPLPSYSIGTNEQGKTSPSSFDFWADNTAADVVLGPQGSWMIVCAGRTNHFDDSVKRVHVFGELKKPDGSVYGKFSFKNRPLLKGGDGFRYVMNLFLVVSSLTEQWAGQPATMWLRIQDDDGDGVEGSVSGTLGKVE